MDVWGWARQARNDIRADGFQGVRTAAQPVYYKCLQQFTRLLPDGENVLDREWDVLVVLDGCRVDSFNDVVTEFDFISATGSVTSVNTMTKGWMRDTFLQRSEELAETAYICGNPFSETVLAEVEFHTLDEIWRRAWDDEIGTLPPRPVTDAAISKIRDENADRYIVHYMQPHHPFISDPELDRGKIASAWNEESWDDVWTRLMRGEVNEAAVRQAYRDNLRIVLDEVELLLNSINADRVVITSDHGNSFGKWGVYGHPVDMPLSNLRRVPWAEAEAIDTGEHTPIQHDQPATSSVQDRLNQLGYS